MPRLGTFFRFSAILFLVHYLNIKIIFIARVRTAQDKMDKVIWTGFSAGIPSSIYVRYCISQWPKLLHQTKSIVKETSSKIPMYFQSQFSAPKAPFVKCKNLKTCFSDIGNFCKSNFSARSFHLKIAKNLPDFSHLDT